MKKLLLIILICLTNNGFSQKNEISLLSNVISFPTTDIVSGGTKNGYGFAVSRQIYSQKNYNFLFGLTFKKYQFSFDKPIDEIHIPEEFPFYRTSTKQYVLGIPFEVRLLMKHNFYFGLSVSANYCLKNIGTMSRMNTFMNGDSETINTLNVQSNPNSVFFDFESICFGKEFLVKQKVHFFINLNYGQNIFIMQKLQYVGGLEQSVRYNNINLQLGLKL